MIRITLTAGLLALAAVPATADTTWTRTGPNGGTASGSSACTAGNGTLNCSRAGVYTAPNGETGTRSGSATATRTDTGVSTDWSRTNLRGQTITGSRDRSR